MFRSPPALAPAPPGLAGRASSPTITRSVLGRAIAALLLALALTGSLLTTPSRAAVAHQTMSVGDNTAAGATTLDITSPSGLPAGQFLLAQVTFIGGADAGTDAQITPAGWTLLNRRDQAAGGQTTGPPVGQAVFHRFTTDAEPATYSFPFATSTVAAGTVLVYDGVNRVAPIVGFNASSQRNANLSTSAVPQVPSGSVAVALLGIRNATTSLSTPTGMTVRATTTNPGGVKLLSIDQSVTMPASPARSSDAGEAAPWVAHHIVLRADPMPGGTFSVGPYCETEGDYTHVLRFTPDDEAETRPIPADYLSYSFGEDPEIITVDVDVVAPNYTLAITQTTGEPGDALRLYLHGTEIATTAGEACPGDGAPDCEVDPSAAGCDIGGGDPDCEVDPSAEGCDDGGGDPDCEVDPSVAGCDDGGTTPPGGDGGTTPPDGNGGTTPPDDDEDPILTPVQEIDIVRVGGEDRIETAINVSESLFDDGGAGAVVLARTDIPADAIAATPFSVVNDAPVLLTEPTVLDPRVLEEILRVLGPDGTVYLTGGVDALAASIQDELDALDITTERIAGVNRFATATEIADRLYGFADFDAAYNQMAGTLVLLADGGGFRDATVVGPAATRIGGAVLLTSGAEMPVETSSWLAAHPIIDVVAVGVGAGAAAPDAELIGDADPFDTATALAERFFPAPAVVGLATAAAFPDPLVGGVDIAHRGGPLLLSAPTALPGTVTDWFAASRVTLAEVRIYGGVGALDATVEASVAAALQP